MAKDPAFLFYTSDFLTGTMFFSNEQVGIYIRLLCAQHQHGAMIEEKAFNSLVKDDELLRSKFQKCDGGYYNERLLHEMSLRNKKSTNISSAMKEVWDKRKKESQKKGIESYNNPNKKQSKKHAKLIGIEDENEIEVKDVSFGKSENLLLKIKDFAVEIENSYSKIEAAARRNKTSPDVIKSMIPDFVDVCITKSKDEDTWYNYCNYFSNWLANEFSKQKKSTQTKSPHQLREMNYNEKP